MTQWTVGDVTIDKVLELEMHWPFRALLPGAEDHIDTYGWLRPDFLTDEGRMRLSIHALVVRAGDLTILVDTCAGAGKPRPGAPAFDMLETDLVSDLANAGVGVDDVDVVICTHLHVDHVGWNTVEVDGTWVPTFPNARYLFVREEYDHWRGEPQEYGPVFDDSVQPVVDAGQADIVAAGHVVCAEVRLEATPGHTPGHTSVVIESGGERAVITGDMIHHPVQFAVPDLCSSADVDQAQAAATRREAFARWQEGPLVIGTHFAGRTAGRLVAEGDAWRFEV